jgi:hypothetical protein
VVCAAQRLQAHLIAAMRVLSITAAFLLAAGLSVGSVGAARAEQLKIELIPSQSNPSSPRMGDALAFRAMIRNDEQIPIAGIIAWITLLQVDPGKEQPVDLEDWSAQKAVTLAEIAPRQTAETEWHLRLIQSGSYRMSVIAVSAADAVHRNSGTVTSPFVAFTVASKPVVETGRVLPIASGVPLAIGAMLLWRGRRSRRSPPEAKDAGR